MTTPKFCPILICFITSFRLVKNEFVTEYINTNEILRFGQSETSLT